MSTKTPLRGVVIQFPRPSRRRGWFPVRFTWFQGGAIGFGLIFAAVLYRVWIG